MKTNITINAIENTISISKAFYKRASVYGSNEYYALRGVMNENPTAKIIFKTIEKKTYSGLTFKKMEDYIKLQPDASKMMIKFDAVKRVAEAKGSAYPLTKKWFLSTFPEYKENVISDEEIATELEALENNVTDIRKAN